MSVGYRAVQWNRAKIVYDAVLVTAAALFIGAFLLIPGAVALWPLIMSRWLARRRPT